jgi:hypothetical protein
LQFCPAGGYVTAQKMRQAYCTNPHVIFRLIFFSLDKVCI